MPVSTAPVEDIVIQGSTQIAKDLAECEERPSNCEDHKRMIVKAVLACSFMLVALAATETVRES